MTTTETTTPAERAKQISDRLLEIGPYPERRDDVTAQGLARYFAVRATVINRQQLSPDGMMSHGQIDLLTVLFTAAHALYALDGEGRDVADEAAAQIWNALEDGQGIGGWLWSHLGDDASREAGDLGEELLRVRQPKPGLLAHADPIRHALNRAMLDAQSANGRDAYMKALHALEEAAAEAEESQS